MKIMYLESKKKNLDFDISNLDFSMLPKKVGIVYTIQFRPFIAPLKKALQDSGRKVFMGKGFRGKYEGQVLGCDAGAAIYIIDKVDCFLFLSSGKWHAERTMLSLPKEKPFFILTAKGIEEVRSDLKEQRKKMLSKFYFSERIGILVSTKAGQESMKNAIDAKDRMEKMGKKAFLFISDMINPLEFENFKIDFWINTACPGLAFDFPKMINYEELELKAIKSAKK